MFTKVHFTKIKYMDMDSMFGQIAIFMLDNLFKVKNMVQGIGNNYKPKINTKASIFKIRKMDKVNTDGETVTITRVHGKII